MRILRSSGGLWTWPMRGTRLSRLFSTSRRWKTKGRRNASSEAWSTAARKRRRQNVRWHSSRPVAIVNWHQETRPRARRQLDGLLAATAAQKNDPLKSARAKAASDLVQARSGWLRSEPVLTKAEAALKSPSTTAYTPRPLEFPRAKTTYRDTPSNAPYSKVSTGRRLALARLDRRSPQSTDGARRGQSCLGPAFRRAFGRVHRTTSACRTPPARTIGSARLAGGRIHGIRAGALSICTG